MIETQTELTRDAAERKIKPGAIALRLNGTYVQVTSWPWFEGEGDDRSARIMVRTEIDNPLSLTEIQYFSLVRFIRDSNL